MVYDRLVRPALFRFGGDVEDVHHRTVGGLAALARMRPALAASRSRYAVADPVTIAGIRFPNRVGLAAGMDKDGRALAAWPAVGFGFVEVGTVTRYPQPGNPLPRLFRLPASDAVINRMGFNNAGAAALARRLKSQRARLGVPLGISIGKSKITPLAYAAEDYLCSMRLLHSYAAYFAVNVSSPNTPGLRSLQDAEQLAALVRVLVAESGALAGGGTPVPVLVKVAPDLTEEALDELVGVCVDAGVAGLIATNTTIGRGGVADADAGVAAEAGGLSGRPLHARAVDVVRLLRRRTDLPIIGVGGIFDAADVRRMLDAGADLIQLYTGLIYRGPELVRAAALEAARAPRRTGPVSSAPG